MPPRISLATLDRDRGRHRAGPGRDALGIEALAHARGDRRPSRCSWPHCWLPGSSRGIDRAFWVGFALFGWTYLILVNWDWVGGQFGHDLTAGISEAAEWLLPEVKAPPCPFGSATPRPPVSTTSPAPLEPCRRTRSGKPRRLHRAIATAADQNRQFRSNWSNDRRSLFWRAGRMARTSSLAERAERSRRAERPASPG